ncbi:cupin domain-containing protein [Rufibacter glacialis]|uniref:Cupin domain-containing protein n=1 Tax=Rufibacter glacialis TaxID=1259555 RepID=A0A5M8QIA1_9BACT|nr:cupin domain-containing protein [Rufibacter glacialis]KAA6435765.1 cupin domain-containing protein [Rufibacter glacialis]GGK66304.1 hypothetical protein GCM10011405_12860 [Rufibacter glacialis]
MSEKRYFLQTDPYRVPTTDGKLIEEHFGLATTRTEAFSVAHMIAPPHWSEPHQTPEFDEVTIVLRGQKQIEIDGEVVVLTAGQTIHIKAGARIRYSNPNDQECEYWSICVPAFDINTVHREDD